MESRARPLSPHLQVYRPQLTSVMSITHRVTGAALTAGILLLVYWLIAAASGPVSFARAQAFMGSWFGLLMLFAWSMALFYHLCNGIRHLMWDVGVGTDIPAVYASGYATLIATAVLTAITWIAALVALH
jgi:succinate dehydrogenase / fumarate reductase, cytochrome b subunit